MPQCAVSSCGNSHRKTKGHTVRYHRFPSENEARNRWIRICRRRGSFNTSTARVCSLHFSESCYERDVEHELLGLPPRSRLKRGAVPDRYLPRQRVGARHRKLRRTDARRKDDDDVTRNDDCVIYGPFEEEKVERWNDDVLLAVGLVPLEASQDGAGLVLNRMHTMDVDAERNFTETSDVAVHLPVNETKAEVGAGYNKLSHGTKLSSEEVKNGAQPETKNEEDKPEVDGEGKMEIEDSKDQGTSGGTKPGSMTAGAKNSKAEDVPSPSSSHDGLDKQAGGSDSDLCEMEEELQKEHKVQDFVKVDDIPSPHSEDENSRNSSNTKQKNSEGKRSSESDSDTSVKKKLKIPDDGELERGKLIEMFFQEIEDNKTLEEIHLATVKLQKDIHTLGVMAKMKEKEWNNIIRLKKVKEEMYLRLQRKKQVMLLSGTTKLSDDWEFLNSTLDCNRDLNVPGVATTVSSGSTAITSTHTSTTVSSSQQSQVTLQQSGIQLLKAQTPLMMLPVMQQNVNLAASLAGVTVPTSLPQQHVSGHRPLTSNPLNVPDMVLQQAREKFQQGLMATATNRMHRPILPKPTMLGNGNGQNTVIGEGRQGPILDVRSIIADYRSRHPECVPRRGRRMKSQLSGQMTDTMLSKAGSNPNMGVLSMASLALGSGSQVRTTISSDMADVGFLLGDQNRGGQDSRPSSADSSRSGVQSSEGNISFKDVLVQFAKMSQTEQETSQQSIKGNYPEVTLHPVTNNVSSPSSSPQSSLLHGILTKSGQRDNARSTTFSPTLARLLTAPDRQNSAPGISSSLNPFQNNSSVSISDLLSSSKGRNELTITPVGGTPSVKTKEEVVLMDEEQEDSADRLVIDESGEQESSIRGAADDDQVTSNGQEISADEVPECQGCHQRAAQFVCAGCGNQWYCSRDCQVAAWDEHSEVCSG